VSTSYELSSTLTRVDHDIDDPAQDRVNVYNGRGVLFRSQGPSWVYGTSNEHSSLYNWQFLAAENAYLGHIQSESPYYHAANLDAPADAPYPPGVGRFPSDPLFDHCPTSAQGDSKTTDEPDGCRAAWAMRIIASRNIFLYGGGFYSFFNNYQDTCAKTGKVCQKDLIDTDYSGEVYLYGLYTVGAERIVNPQGDVYDWLMIRAPTDGSKIQALRSHTRH
jgi:glucan 1,3-beta-glucosidase